MLELKTAVITGPTGVLGSALVRFLLLQGVKIIALVRSESNRVGNLANSDNVIVIECGLDQLNEAPNVIRKQGISSCDAWFHLGWASTFGADARNDMQSQIANVRNSLVAVDAAHQLGCAVFVGAGSQAEYGRHDGVIGPNTAAFPENGYGIAKLAAGAMTRIECEKLGIRHEWVRIFSLYGPFDNQHTLVSSTLRALLNREVPSVTAGEQKWDYLFADDAARALFMVAKDGVDGATYCLGSGRSRSLREYLEMMRDAVDPILKIGFGELPYSARQVMFLQADISTLTADTGFVPEISFEDGIRRTIAWMKEA